MASKDSRSPFTPGVPVPVEYFHGRKAEIERLRRALRQCAGGRNANVFITGERGIGKSSLAAYARALAEREYSFVGAHCYLGAEQTLEGACAHIFERILEELPERSLFEKVREVFRQYIRSVDLLGLNVEFTRERDDLKGLPREFLPKLRTVLKELQPSKKGLVLILDDLNGVSRVPEFSRFIKSFVDEMATSRRGSLPLLLLLVGVQERMDDLALTQPSVRRIFDVAELGPLSGDEARAFFARAFASVGCAVEPDAMGLAVHYSGGFPMLMHEIGDSIFWCDRDGRIDAEDASNGILWAADTVGRKYLEPEVYRAIRSKSYLSILRQIGKMPLSVVIQRSELKRMLPETERAKLDNFLKKMRKIGVLVPGDERGEYRFSNWLHRLYVSLEAGRAQGARTGHERT